MQSKSVSVHKFCFIKSNYRDETVASTPAKSERLSSAADSKVKDGSKKSSKQHSKVLVYFVINVYYLMFIDWK